MLTDDEIREAATSIVGKEAIDKVVRHAGTPTSMLSPAYAVYSFNERHNQRRRAYSEESPVFIPDL